MDWIVGGVIGIILVAIVGIVVAIDRRKRMRGSAGQAAGYDFAGANFVPGHDPSAASGGWGDGGGGDGGGSAGDGGSSG